MANLWIYVGLTGLAALGVITFVRRKWKHAQKKKALAQAATISDFGQRHFRALDRDGDGMISEADLKNVTNSGEPLFRVLCKQFNSIGHVVGHYKTSQVVNCGGLLYAVDVVYEVRSINRMDLQNYPQRVALKYSDV